MKRILLGILCMSSIFLTACWDAVELSDIGIVVMVGFDIDDDGLDRVTILSIQPFGRGGEEEETSRTWIGTASGRSAYEAMRNLRRISTRTLDFSHNNIIVIGEDKAKQGMSNINDIISRSRELRYDTSIFITTGRADEFMQIPATLELSLFREVIGMIENTREWSKGFALEVKDFALNSMAAHQYGFVIGNIGFYNVDRATFSTSRQDLMKMFWKDSQKSIAYISGSAVIYRNRLVGWLSPEELRGYLMISNQMEEGVTFINTDSGYEATINITEIRSEISFSALSEEKITAQVKVKATGVLTELTGVAYDYGISLIETLEEETAKYLASEMALTMDRAQNQLRTDFIGFHRLFNIKYPKEWKELGDNWSEVFCRIPVSYDVEFKIQREGLLRTNIGGEGN